MTGGLPFFMPVAVQDVIMITCLKAWHLPILRCCRRKIYEINVPAAWRRLPGAFAGAHLTVECHRRRVDYFRCV